MFNLSIKLMIINYSITQDQLDKILEQPMRWFFFCATIKNMEDLDYPKFIFKNLNKGKNKISIRLSIYLEYLLHFYIHIEI